MSHPTGNYPNFLACYIEASILVIIPLFMSVHFVLLVCLESGKGRALHNFLKMKFNIIPFVNSSHHLNAFTAYIIYEYCVINLSHNHAPTI